MRLKPVEIAPGLWQTDDYQPQKAAVHALIVGISSYPRLQTGKDIGLQQLAVSALTAYRFFKWLGTKYRHAVGVDIPISARLLLSPTDKELELFAADGFPIRVGDQIGCSARDPHLWNFRNAVRDWFTDAAAVREKVQESRTIFFFSGHGLLIDRDRQLLLPSDYRYTDIDRTEALSTENIKNGMARLAIAKQFYFVDACRSDVASMWDLADATGIPAVPVSKIRNKALVSAVMLGSVADAVTYQPTVASSLDSLSFFGKALIDALEINPLAKLLFDPNYGHDLPHPAICWYPLYQYVNRVVRNTIADFPDLRVPLKGPIAIGETEEDPLLVSVVDGQSKTISLLSQGPLPPSNDGISGAGILSQGPPDDGFQPTFAIEDESNVTFEAADYPPTIGSSWLQTLYAHGGTSLADLILGARAAIWTHSGWTTSFAKQPFEIVAVETLANGSAVRVHVTFNDNGWTWLEMQDPASNQADDDDDRKITYAFLIPETTYERSRFTVTFEIALRSGAGSGGIADVQAILSSRNVGPLSVASRLFDLYRAQTPGRALSYIAGDDSFPKSDIANASFLLLDDQDAYSANDVLQGKTDSPIAATVAALVLLRGRRFSSHDRAMQWLRNLSNWYPYSDASVFAYQASVDEGLQLELNVAFSHLMRIAECGTPFTSEGFGYLLRMFDTYLKPDARGGPPLLTADMLSELPPLWRIFYKNILDVQGAYRGSGLFTTFVAPSRKISKIQKMIS